MLEEWLKKYRDIFGKNVPELVNTDVEENQLIELIKKAIYVDFRPLTLDDLAEVTGEFDIIHESTK